MTEEKKPVPKKSKKPAAPKKEAPKKEAPKQEAIEPTTAKKPTAKKNYFCSHKSRKELGRGNIIEEITVNNKVCYRIKFENLKNNIVFKKEEIIKE